MGKTKNSFIFSFKNESDFKDAILSNVKNMEALLYLELCGPTFDLDLCLGVTDNNLSEYDYNMCMQRCYEKKIRNTDENFLIENYEVFQIIRKEV